MESLKQYIMALGGSYDQFQFDGGQTWTIDVNDMHMRVSFEWGDEARFIAKVRRALDLQPWPTEDDPRA